MAIVERWPAPQPSGAGRWLQKNWPILVLMALTLGGGIAATVGAGKCPSAPAPEVRVTLLHLNDTYEITPLDRGRAGGLARVATLRKELKASNPSTYTLHAGDFLSPSALGNARVGGKRLAGKQMVAVLQAAGVDYIIFGNHEFDLTEQEFEDRLEQMKTGGKQGKMTLFSTNVTAASGEPFAGVPGSQVLSIPGAPERKALRIGLLGLTMDSTRRGENYAKFRPPIAAAQEQIRRWRDEEAAARPSSVIALTHESLAEDEALARAVPGIDLIVGGHEHENAHRRPSPAGGGAALLPSIFRADANVRTVYVHDLFYEADTHRLLRIHSRLQAITEAIAEDAETARIVERYVRRGFAAFRRAGIDPDEKLGQVSEVLDGRESEVRTRSTRLTDLIGDAMLYALPKESSAGTVAVYNGGAIRIDDRILPGVVTMYDVQRVLPFEGQVWLVHMKGGLLQRILDAKDLGRNTGAFLQTRNVRRRDRGEERVWLIAGRELDPNATYQVAINDYLLAGKEQGFEFLSLPKAKEEGRAIGDWRQVVGNYLKAVKTWPSP
jgi:5'-nucleotidase